jgi:hypothetical protein
LIIKYWKTVNTTATKSSAPIAKKTNFAIQASLPLVIEFDRPGHLTIQLIIFNGFRLNLLHTSCSYVKFLNIDFFLFFKVRFHSIFAQTNGKHTPATPRSIKNQYIENIKLIASSLLIKSSIIGSINPEMQKDTAKLPYKQRDSLLLK